MVDGKRSQLSIGHQSGRHVVTSNQLEEDIVEGRRRLRRPSPRRFEPLLNLSGRLIS